MRSIVGCALSHLELWRRIAAQQEPMVVFEDDARLAAGVNVDMLASALQRLPRDADLVWLNDYTYGARASIRYRLHRMLLGRPPAKVTFSAMPDILTTTEAYVITRPTLAGWLKLLSTISGRSIGTCKSGIGEYGAVSIRRTRRYSVRLIVRIPIPAPIIIEKTI